MKPIQSIASAAATLLLATAACDGASEVAADQTSASAESSEEDIDAGSSPAASRDLGHQPGAGFHRGGTETGPAAVHVANAEPGRIVEAISYPGEVRAAATVEIASEMAGRLVTLEADLGQTVSEGDLLAQIDDRELRDRRREARAQRDVARAQVNSARVRLENLEADLERNRPLRDRGLVTEQLYDTLAAERDAADAALEVAQAQLSSSEAMLRTVSSSLERSQVRAPFTGRIAAVHVDGGAVISAGTPLLRLVSADQLVLRVQVNEGDVGRLAIGQPADIRLNALRDERLAGHVVRIGAQVDATGRSVPVEIALDAGGFSVLDGMSGTASIEVAASLADLTVPVDALHEAVDGTEALYVHRDGRAVEAAVETGLRDGLRVEILGGLSPRDEVIVRGQSRVQPGSAVVVRQSAP